MTSAQVVSLVAALGVGGLLAELVRGWNQRRRMDADVTKSRAEAQQAQAGVADMFAQAAATMVGPLTRRVSELEAKLTESEAKAEALAQQLVEVTHELHLARREVAALRDELAASPGMRPDPTAE